MAWSNVVSLVVKITSDIPSAKYGVTSVLNTISIVITSWVEGGKAALFRRRVAVWCARRLFFFHALITKFYYLPGFQRCFYIDDALVAGAAIAQCHVALF